MAAQQFYCPQSTLIEQSTLTDLDGTCVNRANMLDYRRGTFAALTADLGSGEYSLKLDLGSGNALAPTFVGFVDAAAFISATWILYNSADGASWSTVPSATGILSSGNFITTFSAPTAQRYYKLRVGVGGGSIVSGTSGWAELLIGTRIAPSLDPNYGGSQSRDYSGITVNQTGSGQRLAIKRFGTRIARSVNYELISTSDKNLLLSLESTVDGPLKPFMFTVEEGGSVTNKYGRLMQSMDVQETASGLWSIRLLIEEEL